MAAVLIFYNTLPFLIDKGRVLPSRDNGTGTTSTAYMITTRCLPKGVCSWDFNLETEDEISSISFDVMREAGEIVIGALRFEIKKTSMFAGHWTLWFKGQQVAEAVKSSPLHRTFNLSGDGQAYTVEPYAVMSNRFILKLDEVRIGRIEPDHMFTRRATIYLEEDMPRHLMSFAFWLTALMWRRAAQSAA